MKQRQIWLVALLSALTFVILPCLGFAADTSGSLEVGGVITDVEDNTARVNEYVKNRTGDGGSPSVRMDVESVDENSAFGLGVDIAGEDTFNLKTEMDFGRILKLDIELDSLQHWKDHDNLEHIGATFRNDVGGAQPRVTSDLTGGVLTGGLADTLEEAQERYYQELDNDYIVTRREWQNDMSFTLPQLPNLTFHAGMRIESRNGLEQAITASKCGQCHVQANGKEINERTEDFTAGVTGKFGRLTVEYDYLNREFNEDGNAPTYTYLTTSNNRAGIVDDEQLLYSGSQSYKVTPDSEKDSHEVKARYDVNQDSSVSAAYVNAEVESDKAGEPGTYTLDTESLTSEFESFFLKGATRIGGLRLSVRGGTYEIDGPDYYVDFPKRDTIGVVNNTFDNPEHFESAESRDVTELAIDGVYRLNRGTTLRLGYGYEEVERQEEALGETETNTFKVALKSRLSRQLSGRISYQFQDITDPFGEEHAVGIAQISGETDPAYPGLAWLLKEDFQFIDGNPASGAVYYWNSVYPARELAATNLPEEVHEAKFSSTWTPSANMAATFFARVRMEENNAVKYEQNSYVPGFTFYYAPNSKMNLTMAYTFNKQETENRMCVGWYHG